MSPSVHELHHQPLDRERPPVMLLGGVSLLRPLGLASIPVIVATADPHSPALASRYARGRCLLPASVGDELAEALLEAGRRLQRELGRRLPLFYGADVHLNLIYRFAAALSEHYTFLTNPPELGYDLLEKDRFAALACRHGLPVPATLGWSDQDERPLARAAGPVIVKPKATAAWHDSPAFEQLFHSRGKALIFASGRELIEHPLAGRFRELLTVQEYIPGGDEQIQSFHAFADRDGRILAWFLGRKLRTYPKYTGESSFLELIHDEALARLGHEISAKLGLKGVFKIDFKKDPRDGRFYVLEINARFNLWHQLAAASGLNLPAIAYQYLIGEQPRIPDGYATDRKWVDLYLDCKAFRDLHRRGELSWPGWLASLLFARRVHHVLLWKDPRPALWWWRRFLAERRRRWRATGS